MRDAAKMDGVNTPLLISGPASEAALLPSLATGEVTRWIHPTGKKPCEKLPWTWRKVPT